MRRYLLLSILPSLIARAACQAPFWQQPVLLDNRAAVSLVAVDLDNDGAPDLAGVTSTSVFIFRNDGSGNFLPPLDLYHGTMRGTIVAGDFNGDGKADLAFARDGALVVLPGHGDGTFGVGVETTTSVRPAQIAAARFDSGNTLDLAAMDADAGKLVIFRGDGSGALSEVQTSAIGSNAAVMTAGDIDADGKTDVVIAYAASSAFDAFYGRGDGTLASAVTIAAAADAVGLQAADLDGDSRPDLAFVSSRGPVGVLRNLGGHSFAAPAFYPLARDTVLANLTTADLTGDGKPDVAMTSGCGVRTSTNGGSATLVHPWLFDWDGCTIPLPARGGLAAADFDRDGRIDLIVSLPRHETSGDILAFRNLCGDGKITIQTESPLIAEGQSMIVDVDVAQPVIDESSAIWFATGNVALRDGNTVLDTRPLSDGRARFVVQGLHAGNHALVADYAGDAQYMPRQSAPLAVRVVASGSTTTTIKTVPPNGSTYGTSVQVTVNVASNDGGAAPGGPITVTVDDGYETISNLHAPVATTQLTQGLPAGTHTIKATFEGDATHTPSSATLSYTVSKQTPVSVLSPTSATIDNLSFGFGVELSRVGGDPPTGTLTVHFGDKVAPPAEVQFPPRFFDFPAGLVPGHYLVRATYSGDKNFNPVDAVAPFVLFPASPAMIDARGTANGVVLTRNDFNLNTWERRIPPLVDWAATCCFDPRTIDTTATPGIVYLYRAANGTNRSAADVAMIFPFTDDPMLPEQTVTSAHLAELVRAINILRTVAHLPLYPAAAPAGRRRGTGAGGNVPVVTQLRDAINEAREALGAYRFEFLAPVVPNSAITGLQLQELREAVR